MTTLVAHIVFRFDYGGLENGVTNLINALSDDSLCHAVIALTEATEFSRRLKDDVPIYTLSKKPGKDLKAYVRLYKLLRKLRPAIVHTRNMGTMDCALVAFLARVPIRIHGEHGWDVLDPDGTNPKYRRMRRILSPFVRRFVTVSADLRQWLITNVGISSNKVRHIYNGVDIDRFRPSQSLETSSLPQMLLHKDAVVIGSVTRFSEIKDPMNLIDAFVELCDRSSADDPGVRLVMLGDGELHSNAMARLEKAGVAKYAWLPGSRDDVADLLRLMDIFVLGSFREGISNTILEAMASGLPVIATDTGGNRELVNDGITGSLVPPANSADLAAVLATYVSDEGLRASRGQASRDRAVGMFSIDSMIENYNDLYNNALAAKGI